MRKVVVTMTDVIEIVGIRGFGFHGVLPEERAQGQEFIIDVVLHTSVAAAAESDDLEHTVNYAEVAERVHAHIVGDPVNLIETLAVNIATELSAFPGVQRVDVTVHKPSAPIPVPFADVMVRVSRP